jgi:exopolysaccharide biosynthesis polyprenyl glycosylphosphotransferase
MDLSHTTRPAAYLTRPRGVWYRVLNILPPLFDLAAVLGGFVLGYWARRRFPIVPGDDAVTQSGSGLAGLLPTLVIHVGFLLSVFFFARLYHQRRAASRIDQFYAIFAAVSVGVTLISGITTFLFKNSLFDVDYPRQLVLYVWFFTLITMLIGRELYRQIANRLRSAGFARDRVLIVGSGDAARSIISQIRSRPDLGLEIVGAVNGADVREVGPVAVIGHADDLPHLIDTYSINEVIIALPEIPNAEMIRLIGMCQRGRVNIKLYPDMFAYMAGGMSVDELGGMPLLSVRDMPMRGWKLALKRALDIFGAVIGLVMLAPFFVLTAILIRLESPGPIWFCQERTGLDGRPFPMIKFRTMRADAEKSGPGWTVKNDPRVTHVGQWMRKTNWDEIAQLINVLYGQMSLVGPRPEQVYFVEKFRDSIPRYMERHREKAGMTGWAQVNGYRGDTSVEERTKYDLYYVENWSLWFDIKIIIRTIVQTVLRKNENAY